ncbi:MAG: hypothetical protein O2794_01360 [bacterium]|nr:hypothetical protein [bacterium]
MENKKAIALLVVAAGFLVYPLSILLPYGHGFAPSSLPNSVRVIALYLPEILSIAAIILSGMVVMKSQNKVLRVIGVLLALLAIWPIYSLNF